MSIPGAPPDLDRSHHHAGLLLRLVRPDGQADEFYLAGGLTIGRSMANTIVLAGDEAIDRTHARVEIAKDGAASLRCVEPHGVLTTAVGKVQKLRLDAGVEFFIGSAEFKCVLGRRSQDGDRDRARASCPLCGSREVAIFGEALRPCPDCGKELLPVQADSSDPATILLPVTYGPYRAKQYAARGGMSLVLKGERENGSEPVAIKILLPSGGNEGVDLKRFEREVELMTRVQHPNVLKLLDHGMTGRIAFLVLEWVEGPSLRQVIDQVKTSGNLLDFAVAFPWFEQVAKGLAAIHAVGIVHRDIKPSNILLGPLGSVRVADLGIAREVVLASTPNTTTGHPSGTYDYMAPEQINAPELVDGRADLYALGVTFYELLTGMRPIGSWQTASTINPSVPQRFDAVLGRLLEPRSARRHRDIYELLGCVEGIRRKNLNHSQIKNHIGQSTCDPSPYPARVRDTTGLHNEKTDGSEAPVLDDEYTGAESTLCNNDPENPFDPTGRRPWSPWEIAIAILLFGPVWVGVMTGLNWWRMYRPRTAWRPVLIGIASFGLSFLTGMFLTGDWPLWFAVLPIHILTIVLLTYTDLLRQHRIYKSYRSRGGRSGGRVLPIVSGFVLATLMTLAGNWVDRASAAYERGIAAVERHDLDSAIVAFSEAIQHAPNFGEAYQARASTYLDKNDPDRAVSDYARAIGLDPTNANAYHMRGGIFMSRGDYDLAIADCNESIRLDPSQTAAYLKRGLSFKGKGEYVRALADFEICVRLEPGDVLGYLGRGEAHLGLQQADLAIKDFDRVIAMDPPNSATYRERASANLMLNRTEQAIADYSAAIRLDPSDRYSLIERAQLYLETNKNELSLEDCDKMIALNFNEPEVYCIRSIAHERVGKAELSIEDAEQAVRVGPDYPRSYFVRGLSRGMKSELAAAIKDMSRAIELDPRYAEAYRLRSLLYEQSGEKAQAEADARTASQIETSQGR